MERGYLITLSVTAIIMVSCVIAHVGGIASSYQPYWRNQYIKAHISLAMKATDPETALIELNRIREMLEAYPKTGNTDPIYRSPEADLSLAWQSLNEIIRYAETLPPLTSPFDIEHGMAELRVRIENYRDQRWIAYSNILFWQKRAWLSYALAAPLYIVFWISIWITSVIKDYDDSAIPAYVEALIMFIFLMIVIMIDAVPFWYIGLR